MPSKNFRFHKRNSVFSMARIKFSGPWWVKLEYALARGCKPGFSTSYSLEHERKR